MVIENHILKDVESHVISFLTEHLSDDLTYHSISHTKDVVRCVNELAAEQDFSKEEVEILNLAAWFHDVGYTKSVEEHEKCSAQMAREFLKNVEYPEQQIKVIEGCILATKMPQTPSNALEQTICDADLMHLAAKDYLEKADLLHKEIEKTKLCTIPEEEWMQMNQEFLKSHCFFTEIAQKKYTSAVKENLRKVRQRLKEWQKTTK